MKVSWLQLLKNVPALKRAIDALIAPGASKSNTVWFNLIKAAVGLASACGIYVYLSDQEISEIATVIPSVLTGAGFLLDAVVSIRLRMTTTQSLQDKR